MLIVDDHPLFRQGLRGLLLAIDPSNRVDEARDLQEALRNTALARYEMVLLDLKLPGTQGLATLKRFRDEELSVPVVVISGEYSSAQVRSSIELGAMGFVPKTLSPDRMVDALRCVLDGKVYLPEDALPELPDDVVMLPELTTRQREVMRGVVQGKSNKSVARDLGVSSETVKSHLASAMRALGARSRTELVYIAARRGLRFD